MSVPIGLLAAALLFWGRQSGLLIPALACAAAAESWRFVRRRFELRREDFSRVSDLSAVLFTGMAAYAYVTLPAPLAFTRLIAWLPLALLPLLLSQAYSARGLADVRALFVFMRKQPADDAWLADLSYPFLIAVLAAAGAANERTPLFYPEMAALSAWALWPARRRGTPAAVWAGLLAVCAVLGYAGQAGLSRLQASVESEAIRLIFGGPGPGFDAEQSVTALGRLGTLHFSNRIALRLSMPAGQPPPRLLRAATYNVYRRGRWLAWAAPFSSAAQGPAGWTLGQAARAPGAARAEISVSLPDGEGLLPLPLGAVSVAGLDPGALERSRLGAVKLGDGPGQASYEAAYAPGAAWDGPPDETDLEVPAEEEAAAARVARELGLSRAHPRAAARAVAGYFARGFRYSLERRAPSGPAPVSEFLLRSRRGHCEYFATAAALLLRSAGIPARYATGYSIQEYSRLESAWIARDRHAHAWVLAYVHGAWVELDATPASWVAEESAGAPWWQAARDAASWASYRLARWRWRRSSSGPASRRRLLLGALLLALGFWRWSAGLKAVKEARPARARSGRAVQGLDSPWYLVERRLRDRGLARRPDESREAWLRRAGGGGEGAAALGVLHELHLRHRFDPAGLDAAGREVLRRGAEDFLARP